MRDTHLLRRGDESDVVILDERRASLLLLGKKVAALTDEGAP